jgi:hypothetical protein
MIERLMAGSSVVKGRGLSQIFYGPEAQARHTQEKYFGGFDQGGKPAGTTDLIFIDGHHRQKAIREFNSQTTAVPTLTE